MAMIIFRQHQAGRIFFQGSIIAWRVERDERIYAFFKSGSKIPNTYSDHYRFADDTGGLRYGRNKDQL